MKKIKKHMNFFVDPEKWKQFKDIAEHNGHSMTKILIKAIGAYIAKGKEGKK